MVTSIDWAFKFKKKMFRFKVIIVLSLHLCHFSEELTMNTLAYFSTCLKQNCIYTYHYLFAWLNFKCDDRLVRLSHIYVFASNLNAHTYTESSMIWDLVWVFPGFSNLCSSFFNWFLHRFGKTISIFVTPKHITETWLRYLNN